MLRHFRLGPFRLGNAAWGFSLCCVSFLQATFVVYPFKPFVLNLSLGIRRSGFLALDGNGHLACVAWQLSFWNCRLKKNQLDDFRLAAFAWDALLGHTLAWVLVV